MWYYTLDENKNVVATEDIMEWTAWLENANRSVRRTTIKNKTIFTSFISFIGIDYDWQYEKINPNPLTFETMIKLGNGGWLDYQERYRNYKDAVKGHHEAVRMVINEIRKKDNKPND